MQQQFFSFVADHHRAIFATALIAGVAILAAIKRPRRWFHWLIDAVVVIVVAVASLAFWFFTTVTKVIEHRTSTVQYTMLGSSDVHRLAELRGSVVVVNYWATWCPPCRKEMPDLSRLADAYRGKGVVVLTISSEEPEILRKFLAKYPQSTTTARFTSDLPATGIQRMAYSGRPTTIVLGRDGHARRMLIGGRTYDELDAAVRAAM
jgi:thiol-disulfide isomerase/thioredoxin